MTQMPEKTTSRPDCSGAEPIGDTMKRTLAYYARKWAENDHEPPEEREAREQEQQQLAKRARVTIRNNHWLRFASQLGPNYRACRLDNFRLSEDRPCCIKQTKVLDDVSRYVDNMPVMVKDGVNVLLYGPCGTGKDHILTALCHPAIVQYGRRIHWTRGSIFYQQARDAMTAEREGDFINKHTWPDILYFSDPLPPIGNLTPYQSNTLYEVIDERYRMKKPTWMSMNVTSITEADGRIGVATIDRLQENAVMGPCFWPSYRRR